MGVKTPIVIRDMELSLQEIVSDAIESDLICEGGASKPISHMFKDPDMTFGEMRDMFKSIFSGETTITEKTDGQNLMVTYKDGKFGFARNRETLKEPMDRAKLGEFFEGKEDGLKDAFCKSAKNLEKALSSIDAQTLGKIFSNGRNFLNVEIVYPPFKNLVDYGNRCILQLNALDEFDGEWNEVGENTEYLRELENLLSAHKALKQEMFTIQPQNVLTIAHSPTAKQALETILESLDKLASGLGYDSTIKDYFDEKWKKRITDSCSRHGFDVDPDSMFVQEFSDRLSRISGRRPTKSDVVTFAKKAGINPRTDDYRSLVAELESGADEVNEEILVPIEDFITMAGVLIMKNVTGFLAADPNKTSKRILSSLDSAIRKIEEGEVQLAPDKMKLFRKNLRKIEKYQDKYIPAEGVLVRYRGKVYKITSHFAPVNQILGLIKYK